MPNSFKSISDNEHDSVDFVKPDWFAWDIYTLSSDEGEVRYVGFSRKCEKRYKQHLSRAKIGDRTYKACWIKKVLESGRSPILNIVESGYGPEWSTSEKYWIGYFNSIGCRLTNLTSGGDGPKGLRHSDESKLKMRNAKLGCKHLPEFGAAISQRQKGIRHDKNFGAKVSAGKKGKKFTPQHCNALSKAMTTERLQRLLSGQKSYWENRRMKKQQLITGIGKAIAVMEGYWLVNSIANKNHNPGNIRTWGKTPIVKGFACFKRADDGWAALYKQIENNITGMGAKDPFKMRSVGLSLREFFQGQRDEDGQVVMGGYPGYAPDADGNNAEHYAKYVAKSIGVNDIDVKLKTLITE